MAQRDREKQHFDSASQWVETYWLRFVLSTGAVALVAIAMLSLVENNYRFTSEATGTLAQGRMVVTVRYTLDYPGQANPDGEPDFQTKSEAFFIDGKSSTAYTDLFGVINLESIDQVEGLIERQLTVFARPGLPSEIKYFFTNFGFGPDGTATVDATEVNVHCYVYADDPYCVSYHP